MYHAPPLLVVCAATIMALIGGALAFQGPTKTTWTQWPLPPPSRTRSTAGGGGSSGQAYFPSLSRRNARDEYATNGARRRRLSLSPLPQVQDVQLQTLSRILLPSLASYFLASNLFPPLALSLSYLINDAATFAVLSVDSSQFIQNFLTVTGLTFSILVGQTYYFMYQQQEAVFISLFREVTETKSLLEQVTLVCQGRRDMYVLCLTAVQQYVKEDLNDGWGKDPARVLSARPMDDPLEVIMYLTSVGTPSTIYDTVRSLRQARAIRLAALQKKLPPVHFHLLWLLAAMELSCFPILGAGTQTIGGYNILTVEGCLFGIMTFGIVLTLNVVGEMYMGSGGAYNVDSVLRLMVRGLEEELETRMRRIDVDITKRAQIDTGEALERRGAGMLMPSSDIFSREGYRRRF